MGSGVLAPLDTLLVVFSGKASTASTSLVGSGVLGPLEVCLGSGVATVGSGVLALLEILLAGVTSTATGSSIGSGSFGGSGVFALLEVLLKV